MENENIKNLYRSLLQSANLYTCISNNADKFPIQINKKDFTTSIIKETVKQILSDSPIQQKELAERLGISKQVITEYSKGRSIPSLQSFLAMILEVYYAIPNEQQNIKYLYYNPIEPIDRVHIVSKMLEFDKNITNEYQIPSIEDLFILANSDIFDKVEVFLSKHNEAYYIESPKFERKIEISGWVSLKNFMDGKGYLQDII